ncbi:hypothetical protein KAU32_02820 [bacterium]|nr:hypothetical protein [bacterium]
MGEGRESKWGMDPSHPFRACPERIEGMTRMEKQTHRFAYIGESSSKCGKSGQPLDFMLI